MFFNKTTAQLTIITLTFSMLFGCATTYHGDGIIVSEQKIGKKNHLKEGAKAGVRGATVGGTASASFVLWYGLMEAGVPSTLVSAGNLLAGMAILGSAGALAIAVPAAVTAVGTSYVINKSNKKDIYQFNVKSLNKDKTFIIKQYAVPMPVNTKVRIIERNGSVFMKKKTTP
jgi:hypothetical protein